MYALVVIQYGLYSWMHCVDVKDNFVCTQKSICFNPFEQPWRHARVVLKIERFDTHTKVPWPVHAHAISSSLNVDINSATTMGMVGHMYNMHRWLDLLWYGTCSHQWVVHAWIMKAELTPRSKHFCDGLYGNAIKDAK